MTPTHGRTVFLTLAVLLVGGLAVTGLYAATRPAPVLRVRPVEANVPAAPASGAQPSSSGRRRETPVVSPSWVVSTASSAGISETAVRAYGTATLRSAQEDPGCHLAWTTLAGIGWVESQQGTIGGRVLKADGRPDRPVTGVPLDGSGDVAAVPDAAGGYQHALGPLQFLPSTWQQWRADGDGDGVEDPQDLDDAALAAARYLCSSGSDLTTGAGWSAAVFSYNHSADYVRSVYAAAQAYAQRTARH